MVVEYTVKQVTEIPQTPDGWYRLPDFWQFVWRDLHYVPTLEIDNCLRSLGFKYEPDFKMVAFMQGKSYTLGAIVDTPFKSAFYTYSGSGLALVFPGQMETAVGNLLDGKEQYSRI